MSHTVTDPFLQAILQTPDDDTPRLVYADWLEEQGEPAGVARAEFIRIQCALAREKSAALVCREQELLGEYESVWSQPVRGMAREWQFERGFIAKVTMQLEVFLRGAKLLFERAPVQHLLLRRSRARYLPDIRKSLSNLSSCEYVQRVRSLDLRDNSLNSDAIQTLAVAEKFNELTSLSLAGNRIGDGGLRALATAPFLPRLTSLDLSRNAFTAVGVRRFIETCEELMALSEGLRLRRLVLRGNPSATTIRRLLITSPLFRNIVRW